MKNFRIILLLLFSSISFQSIAQRDIIVVESVIMLLVLSVVLVTFLVDIAYVIVDPRLRSSIL